MSKIIFIIGSVTTAARLKKEIEKMGGIEAEVIHTPAEISGGSCSYSVRVNYDSLLIGLEASKAYNIKIKKIYREASDGKERIYDDIS